jgi:serine/threonine protein kinase
MEASARVWDLTGQTGAARYMAPEVYLCQPYGLRSETYSLSLVLWHMLTKQLPYDGLLGSGGIEHFERKVVHGGRRPPTQPDWPVELRRLLEECLRPTASQRPSMAELASRLRRVYVDVGNPLVTPPGTPGSCMTPSSVESGADPHTPHHSTTQPQSSVAAFPAVGPAAGVGPGRSQVTPITGPAREVEVRPSAPVAPVDEPRARAS